MFIAWLCGASSLAVTWIQARWYVFHPHYLPLTILFVGLALATLVGMGCGLWRAIRGPDRWRAALKVCAILPPVCIWGHVGLTARANWSDRWVPNTFAMRIATVMGVTLMRLEADFAYRRRLESDRILMYYDPHRSPYVECVDRPDEDLAAMDRHLARLEDLLGERISGQVYWIRGPALGSEFLSLHGLALGSAWSPEIPDSYRGDRHELAHAALDSFRMPGSDPPYVLHEGWAMAQCGDSRLELAKATAKLRAEIPGIGPRELLGPTWYYRCTLPVYSIGGAFVEFLIRTFDAQRFLRFYTECTPTNVDDKCEELFQVNIDDLEAAFWKDVDRSLRDAAPPNTTLSVP